MTNSIDSVAGVDDFATMVKDLMAERDKLKADLAAARKLLIACRPWTTIASDGTTQRIDAFLAQRDPAASKDHDLARGEPSP